MWLALFAQPLVKLLAGPIELACTVGAHIEQPAHLAAPEFGDASIFAHGAAGVVGRRGEAEKLGGLVVVLEALEAVGDQ